LPASNFLGAIDLAKTETAVMANETGSASADEAARLRAVVGRLGRQLRPTQAGAGLTPTQISVLFMLARRGPLRLSELAELEGLNPTMLSRVVAALADDGLLARASDPADRRAAVVDATPAGRRLREKIHRERSIVLGGRLAALSPAERESLLAALPALEALADQAGNRSR
jgi:DNA-binding MarR family transcriptional regulator